MHLLRFCAGVLTLIVVLVQPVQRASAAPLPDGGPSAADALNFLLSTIERGELSEQEVEAWFAPSFLEVVGVRELVATIEELARTLRPVTVVGRTDQPPRFLSARLATRDGGYRVHVVMSPESPRKIAELLLVKIPATYAQARALLEAAGARSQILVAELKDGACTPRIATRDGEALAIGSTFKLWVLLALDEKLCRDARLDWDTQMAVRDDLKSLPSGVLQNEPAGSKFTLRHFATQMISISDNTATDHLIGFVGREAVEAAQSTAHHARPEANVPWLMTREMFRLKTIASDAERTTYRRASVPEKRALLATLGARPLTLADAADWTTPRALDIEWLASARDVCNVWSTLGTRAAFDPSAETLRVTSVNPGIELDRTRFTYVGFKGGSEVGVLHLSWLLRRADGRWFVVVVGVNDATHEIDANVVLGAAEGILELLGNEP